jgi:ribose transport system ATP-binding protein
MTIVEFHDVTKRFGPVEVLHGISFALEPGHILGLVGENGSGKSTSMNILGGIYRPTSGRMLFDGKPYAPSSPADALQAGVGFIHQELNLFENLSIEENLFIERFPRRHRFWPLIHRQAIRRQTRELLEMVQVKHSPDTLVNRLSPGERQLVEIAKALNAEARIIILDEPTTSLAHREIDCLFKIINRLKQQGIAMIYISHILADVQRLCDEVVVLRNGRVVSTGPITEYDAPKFISDMVGRNIQQLFPVREHAPLDRPVLKVHELAQKGVVRDISLELHAGEVLGLAGLMGSGRSELARILFGLAPYQSGTIEILGEALHDATVQRCMARGMAFLTEDRRREGLMMTAPLLENIALPSLRHFAVPKTGWLRRGKLTAEASRQSQRVQVNTDDLHRLSVHNLSGGNQQKVVLAKWLMRGPQVFILDEPTRGIDIGAKHEIYKLINDLVAQDAGVLMISSEIEELVGTCDRILVMGQGRIQAEFTRDQFNNRDILEAALWSRQDQPGEGLPC